MAENCVNYARPGSLCEKVQNQLRCKCKPFVWSSIHRNEFLAPLIANHWIISWIILSKIYIALEIMGRAWYIHFVTLYFSYKSILSA